MVISSERSSAAQYANLPGKPVTSASLLYADKCVLLNLYGVEEMEIETN